MRYLLSLFVLLSFILPSLGIMPIFRDPYTVSSLNNTNYYSEGPGQYYRIDYQWYLKNTGQASRLYLLNGTPSTVDAGGTNDTGYFDAESLFPTNLGLVRFAVIDNGISLTHPDFTGLPLWGKNIMAGTSDIADVGGHGSCVGGVMFAKKNGLGYQGMLQNVPSITIAKVSFRSTDEIANAIYWCVTNNVKIMNLSWGTAENNVNLKNAVLFAQQNGAVVVCAVPNVEQNLDVTLDYPACWKLDNVVAVTSITRGGIKYNPSAYGFSTVHLAAPGRVIPTTGLNPAYVYSSGTSFASPIVTSALVLIANKYPYQPYQYWIERLMKGVTSLPNLTGRTISGGTLNLVNSMANDPIKLTNYFDRVNMTLVMTATGGFNSGTYLLQSSPTITSTQWTDVMTMKNNQSYGVSVYAPAMFFRVKPLDYPVSNLSKVSRALVVLKDQLPSYKSPKDTSSQVQRAKTDKTTEQFQLKEKLSNKR